MRTVITVLIVALAAGPVRAEEDGSPDPELEAGPGEPAAEAADDAEDAPETAEPAAPSIADPESECSSLPVTVKRVGVRGSVWLQLTDCKGAPVPAAAQALSALALPPRPRDRGGDEDAEHDGEPGDDLLPRVNPELLVRLQRVAERYPGRAIEIVSGYRTRGRAGSRHRSFDALDIRVEGVANEELVAFARTFEGTGVGYYPNSSFVHLDVRETTAYWVDQSGPGEPARYASKSELEAEPTGGAEAVAHQDAAAVVEPEHVADAAEPTTEPAAEPAVAAAATTEPTANQPAAPDEPAEAEPVTAEPATVEPVDPEPASAEPASAEPVTAEPVTAEPVTAEPVTAEPVTAEPVTAKPVPAEPAVTEPAASEPAPDAPQLHSLAERALAVMNRALGRAGAHDSALPGRQAF